MDSGELRDRLEIQQPISTPDAFGAPVVSWETVATRWGLVEPLGDGKEDQWTRKTYASVSHRIRLRYHSGVTPLFRLKWGTRIFHLASVVNPDERKRELLCVATEVLGES